MRGFLSRWGRERRDGAFQKRLTSATVAGPNYLIAFLLLHGGLYRPAEWRQSALTWPDPEQAACALYRPVTESAQRRAENSERSQSLVRDRNYEVICSTHNTWNKLKQLNKSKGEKMCTNRRQLKIQSDIPLTCLKQLAVVLLMTWSCSDVTDRRYKHTSRLWRVKNTSSFNKTLVSSICPQTRRILQVFRLTF